MDRCRRPGGQPVEVQYLSLDGNGHAKGSMKVVETEASALSLPLSDPERNHLWRVVRTHPANARYAAAPWRVLERGARAGAAVGGQVRFEIDPTDDRAMRLVDRLAQMLGAAGIGVAVSPVAEGPERSAVLFSFVEDLARATELAVLLPGLGAGDARRTGAIDVSPGEIVVRIAFRAGSAADMDVEHADGG